MQSKMWMSLLAMFCLAMVAACEAPSEEEAPAEEAQVEEEAPAAEEAEPESELVLAARDIAALRAKIQESPERIDAILAEAEMTKDELEAKIFEITVDPQARAAYVDASK